MVKKNDKEERIQSWKSREDDGKEGNPAGEINLDDDDLEGVTGGAAFATEHLCTDGCCGATECTGTCAGQQPTTGCCGSSVS